MSKLPQILRSETIAQTRIFTAEQRELQFANGTVVTYERLLGRKPGAVLVVPMLDNETVVLIREYAGGVHRYELGCPKGLIQHGESAEEATDRELKEEIGYGAHKVTHLGAFTIAPGYLEHQTQILLAQELYPAKLPGDEPEEIEVIHWPLANLVDLVSREDFTEARSIAALFMVRELLGNG